MDSQLAGITRISELKWRAHSPGCWEHPSDFSSLSVQEFLCYGNIPIVAKLESEIMLDRISWWIRRGFSLVHFPCRLSRRSYSGRTCFFPAEKPKMTAGRWCPAYPYFILFFFPLSARGPTRSAILLGWPNYGVDGQHNYRTSRGLSTSGV